jgi:hypothetical protein
MDKKPVKIKLSIEDETAGTKTVWFNTDTWEITDEQGVINPPGEQIWATAIQKLSDSKLIDVEYAQFPVRIRERVALAYAYYKTGKYTIAGIGLKVDRKPATINRWFKKIKEGK